MLRGSAGMNRSRTRGLQEDRLEKLAGQDGFLPSGKPHTYGGGLGWKSASSLVTTIAGVSRSLRRAGGGAADRPRELLSADAGSVALAGDVVEFLDKASRPIADVEGE
jgi:hypothetical protein